MTSRPPGSELRPPLPRVPRPPRPKRPSPPASENARDRLAADRNHLPDVLRLVSVAKLGRPWGVHGDLTVRLHHDESDLAWAGPTVLLRGEAFPLARVDVVTWAEKAGKLLVRLAGIESPELAKELVGLEILVDRDELPDPPDDEYYAHELTGMAVVDEARGPIGRIARIEPQLTVDVWVVRSDEGGEIEVPATRQFIQRVDRASRTVHVRYDES